MFEKNTENILNLSFLYLDAQVSHVEKFKQIFDNEYAFFTACTTEEAKEILNKHKSEIGIVFCENLLSFDDEDGISFFLNVKKKFPSCLRVMLTDFSSIGTEAIAELINRDIIHFIIDKNLPEDDLAREIKMSVKKCARKIKRDLLLHKKVDMLNEIIESDKEAAYNDLAQGLNHHLRNVLTPVKFFIELAPSIIQEAKDGEVDDELWENSHREATGQLSKAYKLLDRLWETSAFNELRIEDEVILGVNLLEVCEQFSQRFQEKGISYELQCEDNLPLIKTNKKGLLAVFRLYFEESLSQLSAGQNIDIKIERSKPVETGEIEIEGVNISFRDDGTSLDEEKIKKIFKPFFVRNASPEEYGINLSACYSIVNQLGGRIYASSNQTSSGITIKIWLPLDANQVPKAKIANLNLQEE